MLTYTLQLYKKAYSGLSRNSWYLSLVMLVNRSGTMVLPFMTIYCTQKLHFSIAQAGIVMSLFGAGAIAGAFLGGRITDRYGFYDVQVFALLTGGLFFLLLGWQHSFTSICVVAIVLSMCNESFRPANSTAIAHYSNEENRTRSYSLNRLAVNLGWAVGGGLGGFLASVNYHLLFWADGITNIGSALLLLRLMPRSDIRNAITDKAKQMIASRSAYRDGRYISFLVLVVLFASCFFQLFTMQPVFYKTQWHMSEQMIGLLMTLNGLLIISIEMIIIHKVEGRRPPLFFIGFGVAIAGSGFALLNVLPSGVMAATLVVILITLGEVMSMPFMNAFWVSRTNAGNRGQYAAMYTMAWSAAQIIAPTMGSLVIEHGGYTWLWWLVGGICLTAATGFMLMYRAQLRSD